MPKSACTFALAMLLTISVESGAQKKTPAKAHSHGVVEVIGQPVLSAIKIKLDKPRRVILDGHGGLLIADSGANRVFRVDKSGKVTTFADGLSEPSGLFLDTNGDCYISNHADGEAKKGSVVRVGKDGKKIVVADKLTGPKGLVKGRDGTLYVALFSEDRIIAIGANGKTVVFAKEINTPAGLCFDAKGNLLAVNSVDGTVTKIDAKRKATRLCGGLRIPSDIAVGPDGEIVVANYGGTQLTRIHPNGKTTRFLGVPEQTIGLCFDKAGNLIVVNWASSWAVKATIRMFVPCPHCKKKIPIRLRPKKKAPSKKII